MRIRLPGGYLTPEQLGAFGSEALDLSRATDARLPDIVASPLSGRVGEFGDVRGLVRELDAALGVTEELTQLPEGFWFSLDDGRGDVAGLGANLGARLRVDPVSGDRADLLVDGRTTGLTVDVDDVVDALLGAANRAVECTDPTALFDDAVLGAATAPHGMPPIGWIEQNDGLIALGAAVPGGIVSGELVPYLAAIDRPITVTPWRSIVIFDLDEAAADVVLRVLAPRGLVFDADFSAR